MNARSIVTRAVLSAIAALFSNACTTNENPVEPVAQPASRSGLHIVASTPTKLTAVVNTTIEPTPTVVVRDDRGVRVRGIVVRFQQMTGDGRVAYKAALTNEDGIATPGRWTAGIIRGTQTLEASSSDSPDKVTFEVEAIPDLPAKLISLGYDTGPSALPNDTTIVVVQTADRFGNRVEQEGLRVMFGVMVDDVPLPPVTLTTDSSGQTRFPWILGTAPMTYELAVSAPGMTGFTRTLHVLDIRSTTVYDLQEIAGNPPRERTIEKAYIALGNDGSFIDVVTGLPGFELEGTTQLTGTYEQQGERILLEFSSTYSESAYFSGDDLLVQRWDPHTYSCCVTWLYRKRGT